MTETSPALPPPVTPQPRARLAYRPWAQRATAAVARGAAAVVRALGPETGGSVASFVARIAAPMIRESGLALTNLAAAFPERTEAERQAILRGAWDNLARTVAELPHLTRMVWKDPVHPEAGFTDRIEIVGGEWLDEIRDSGKTAVGFMAHFGNWEILPLVSLSYGMRGVTLYRPIRNARLQEELTRWRGDACDLVISQPGAALRLATRMKHGQLLCVLVDQRMPEGVEVPFFGRPALSNPLIARLARQFDCPIHGARAIRLPGSRFRIEITPPLAVPRDVSGKINSLAATGAMNATIEGWVREYPEQWLWLHNRWGIKRL